jgi:hypothetical protein
MNFLAAIAHSFGSSAVLQLLEMEAGQLAHQNRDAIVRAFTIPAGELQKWCARTGASVTEQQSANAKFAEAAADFLIGFAP